MVRARDSWKEITYEDLGALGDDRKWVDYREGWTDTEPEHAAWQVQQHGVRPCLLCSDRARKYCMKMGGVCSKGTWSLMKPSDVGQAKERFLNCRRYCIQQVVAVADRPKELRLRNQG